MALVAVGLNHKTAPVAVRERLAFADQTLAEPLARLHDPVVEEVVILSTCNRVEFYLQGPDAEAGVRCCIDFLATYHGLSDAYFVPHLYQLHDAEAVRHLFRVASSLDSMVLGEPQILGQVKTAYFAARAAHRTGVVLTQLFERALNVAKMVRSATGISDHAVSVSYAAVELAKKIFERLHERTAMVLGAGETSELAARHLMRQGVTRLFVANRSPQRAAKLAQELQAKAIPWEEFAEYLVQADIILSSTSAPQPIIQKAMIQEVMRARKHRPMFFIDIAVPRDIDAAINTLENVFLYNIDDLENVVEANRRERQQEALVAEDLVWREVRHFQQWLAARDAVPTIVALRQWAETMRLEELDKALGRLGPLDERQRRAIEALTVGLVNKLLHVPTVNLKRSSREGQGRDYVQLVRHLFELDS
jgi:glutamyl-tRNA reductase